MQTWYRAVCDEHREMIHVLVTNPLATVRLLGDSSEVIQAWLSRHYLCKLRLIHRDEELDEVLGVYEDTKV